MGRIINGALATGALAVAFAIPPAASARTHCGFTGIVERNHASAQVRVEAGRATCTGARSLIRHAFKDVDADPYLGVWHPVRGWTCYSMLAQSEIECRAGARAIFGTTHRADWI